MINLATLPQTLQQQSRRGPLDGRPYLTFICRKPALLQSRSVADLFLPVKPIQGACRKI